MQSRKTIVLFDIGGVLLRLNYWNFIAACAKASGCTEEEFRENYIQSNVERRALAGKIDAEGFLKEFEKVIRNGITEPKMMELIAMTWGEPIAENIKLKKRIYDAGYSVGLFSNISDIAFRILSKRHPEVFDLFDPSFPKFFSCQIGEIKPNKKMYEKVKGYDSIVYIDDDLAYVAEAARRGWKGIFFTQYIDKDEVQRTFDRETKTDGIITANSQKELMEALRQSGIGLNQ
jgi:FMN phosphatase YigB (HAD superfamily)